MRGIEALEDGFKDLAEVRLGAAEHPCRCVSVSSSFGAFELAMVAEVHDRMPVVLEPDQFGTVA